MQPAPEDADYFEVFSLSRKFAIDTAALEKKFYSMSRKLHPDAYARASKQEQEWSLRAASLLNDAYRTLKDPIARTEYFLRLQAMGVDQDGEPSSAGKCAAHSPDDLLEGVFELNMQLEEMRTSRATGEGNSDLRRDLLTAKKQFEAQLSDTDRSIEQLSHEWDNDFASGPSIKQQLVSLLDRRRYIHNLVRDVSEAVDESLIPER